MQEMYKLLNKTPSKASLESQHKWIEDFKSLIAQAIELYQDDPASREKTRRLLNTGFSILFCDKPWVVNQNRTRWSIIKRDEKNEQLILKMMSFADLFLAANKCNPCLLPAKSLLIELLCETLNKRYNPEYYSPSVEPLLERLQYDPEYVNNQLIWYNQFPLLGFKNMVDDTAIPYIMDLQNPKEQLCFPIHVATLLGKANLMAALLASGAQVTFAQKNIFKLSRRDSAAAIANLSCISALRPNPLSLAIETENINLAKQILNASLEPLLLKHNRLDAYLNILRNSSNDFVVATIFQGPATHCETILKNIYACLLETISKPELFLFLSNNIRNINPDLSEAGRATRFKLIERIINYPEDRSYLLDDVINNERLVSREEKQYCLDYALELAVENNNVDLVSSLYAMNANLLAIKSGNNPNNYTLLEYALDTDQIETATFMLCLLDHNVIRHENIDVQTLIAFQKAYELDRVSPATVFALSKIPASPELNILIKQIFAKQIANFNQLAGFIFHLTASDFAVTLNNYDLAYYLFTRGVAIKGEHRDLQADDAMFSLVACGKILNKVKQPGIERALQLEYLQTIFSEHSAIFQDFLVNSVERLNSHAGRLEDHRHIRTYIADYMDYVNLFSADAVQTLDFKSKLQTALQAYDNRHRQYPLFGSDKEQNRFIEEFCCTDSNSFKYF